MAETSLFCNDVNQVKDGDKSTKPSLNVQSGKIEPQRHEANNRRPLTPFLSFRQLDPFEAIGDGCISSPYLSPPAPGDISSPPPQKEGNSYFGSNSQRRTRIKPLTMPEAVSRSPLAESGNMGLDKHAETRDLVTQSTLNESNDIGVRNPLRTPVVSSAKETTQNQRVLRFETLPHRRTVSRKAQPDSNDNVAEHQALNHESIAVRTLRRYSEASVHAENWNRPPLLQSIASTLNMLFASKNLDAFESSSDEDVEGITDATSRKKSKNSISHAANDRRRAKAKEHVKLTAGLNVPATITLRKASALYQSEPKTGTNEEPTTAEILQENGPAFGAAVTAMAFQNRPFDSTCLSSSEEHQARRVAFPKYSGDEPRAARERAMSVAGLSGTLGVQRHSLLAEAALTLEEAHLDPGKFTIRPNLTRHSVSAAGTLRRLSTIEAGLGSSVHEIIWQEDEVSKGTSSPASVSPPRKESLPGTSNSGTEQRPFDNDFAETALNFWSTGLSAQGSSSKRKQSVSYDAMLHLRQSYGNMFNWSWHEQPLGVANPNLHPTDPPTTMEPNSSFESQQGRPSISKTSRIQSFPALSSRKHTSEWRKAPLPDLNDPTIGRAPHEFAKLKYPDGVVSLMDLGLDMYSSIPNAVSASLAPDVDAGLFRKTLDKHAKLPHAGKWSTYNENPAPAPNRSKSVSYAPLPPARMTAEGKVGSSIGISSHKRVGR